MVVSNPRIYSLARPSWLALHQEDVIDPGRPIVDPHHHLWDRVGERYMFEQVQADMTSSHYVVATVFVECHSMYRKRGPESHAPIGEVEFAKGIAATSASGDYGSTAICAGIVGHADLTLGDDAGAILEAEIAVGGGRFRGIRYSTAYDADPAVAEIYPMRPKGLMASSEFRRGFACLAPLGLTFDAWLFHPQIDELADLARVFPDTKIVLDHCGGPVGVGNYAERREETFRVWKASIERLAKAPNVFVKLGGLAIRLLGHNFEERPIPPSSEELAAVWRPYIETCIAAFGPSRCMFESNFPPDKGQCSFLVLFNAFKRIAAQYSDAEQAALFSKTATEFYSLEYG